jgi:di/tricarboxylate transporter
MLKVMKHPYLRKITSVSFSLVFPLIIFIWKPLGLAWNQAAVIAGILLVVIWWTTNIIKKLYASLFLLFVFIIASKLPVKTIFSFTLSETFVLIAVCYLFSVGLAKSGLTEKLFMPILYRFAKTPVSIIISMTLIYTAAIYLIPQPLARLIIISGLYDSYFRDSHIPDQSREILNFASVLIYIFVNMSFKSGDLIINTGIQFFADVSVSELEWINYNTLPSMVTAFLVWLVFFIIFKKHLKNIRIPAKEKGRFFSGIEFSKKEKMVLVIVVLTIVFWMTSTIHGISPAIIVLIATVLLFAVRALDLRDILKLDISTLVFLSAAFSIGGVLKGTGAADILFMRIEAFLPDGYSLLYVAVVVSTAILMHLILGSNTTTCSVVIPGLIAVSGRIFPPAIIAFIVYYSMIYHAILPFHSVSVMICSENNYFSAKYVTRLGIPVTLIVYISILFVYIPWWWFRGYLY